MLFIDLETRSNIDLKTCSLVEYVTDFSTEIICISYAFGLDNSPRIWFADDSPVNVLSTKFKPLPQDLINYLNSNGPIYAHNAEFERLIFDYILTLDYNAPVIDVNRWRCTRAQAMASGLPGSLANLSRVLDLQTPKQEEGKRLIDTYSKPGFKTKWQNDDKDLMAKYCQYDVLACREIYTLTRKLTDQEWSEYSATQVMNDEGIPFDIDFAKEAITYAEEIKGDTAAEIYKITNGRIPNATERKQRDIWLKEKLTDVQYATLFVWKNEKGERVKKFTFDEKARNKLKLFDDLDLDVFNYIEQVELAGGSAIKKYAAINRLNVEGRVYGSLLFNGASTGRYSAQGGLQIQNFKRETLDNATELMQDVKEGYEVDKPAQTLAKLLRSSIVSSKGITYSDYSQIEARVLPWLYPHPQSDKVLQAFRDDKDLYIDNAMRMFNINDPQDVTKDLRQAAKVATLACGFGGGKGAVKLMAGIYNLQMSDNEADQVKNNWRQANTWAPRLWEGLKSAAHSAIYQEGVTKTFGRISFIKHGDFLYMQLPSGRFIAYYQPKIETIEVGSKNHDYHFESEEITALWPSVTPRIGEKWPRRTINFLTLAENATQAVAADIMRATIVRAVDNKLPIIFSVHDELVAEGDVKKELHDCMEIVPDWATDLPIKADTQYNERYGK